ncbi:hypothetical protein HY635_03980 [Candidatus Uhrbacteria bacterium]|nr:hypothetical protein [Candidatus Uhrbacteria bacterium]
MPSLQAIQDQYERRGLLGEALRRALAEDEEYQRLLAERQSTIARGIGVTAEEREQYVIATERDLDILDKVKRLDRCTLSEDDARIVALIRTQLEHDWRTPLLAELNRLMGHYDLDRTLKSQI